MKAVIKSKETTKVKVKVELKLSPEELEAITTVLGATPHVTLEKNSPGRNAPLDTFEYIELYRNLAETQAGVNEVLSV